MRAQKSLGAASHHEVGDLGQGSLGRAVGEAGQVAERAFGVALGIGQAALGAAQPAHGRERPLQALLLERLGVDQVGVVDARGTLSCTPRMAARLQRPA